MMVGCGDYPVQYDLTISSTRGGEVTSPGEGSFAYAEGTVVNLAAEAEDGYRFVRWTGNVDTVANINSVTTAITMNGSYSIAASFQLRYASVVAAGSYHTVGLRADGTVVAVGRNDYEQCDVGGWSDIVQVAAGDWHTVGLKHDDTVVAIGDTLYGQCDVGDWSGIIQIAAGALHTVGLSGDGSVIAVGDDYLGQCDVGGWSDIVQVAAGDW
ncbi:MAG: chromosome condensation regulator, partial [Dehalococcoidia bacterium]